MQQMADLADELELLEMKMMFQKARNKEQDDVISRLKQLCSSAHQTLKAIRPFADMLEPKLTTKNTVEADQSSLVPSLPTQHKTAPAYMTILKTGLTQLASFVKAAELTGLQEKPTFVLVLAKPENSEDRKKFHKHCRRLEEERQGNDYAPALPYNYYSISDPRDVGSPDAWLELLRKRFRLQQLSLDISFVTFSAQSPGRPGKVLYNSSVHATKRNFILWNRFKSSLHKLRDEKNVGVEITARLMLLDTKPPLMKHNEVAPGEEGFYATLLSKRHPLFGWQISDEDTDDQESDDEDADDQESNDEDMSD